MHKFNTPLESMSLQEMYIYHLPRNIQIANLEVEENRLVFNQQIEKEVQSVIYSLKQDTCKQVLLKLKKRREKIIDLPEAHSSKSLLLLEYNSIIKELEQLRNSFEYQTLKR